MPLHLLPKSRYKISPDLSNKFIVDYIEDFFRRRNIEKGEA